MNYQAAWDYLDSLQFFKIKLGLESMHAFLDQVGHPQRGLPFVHVAGTNGKGSVAAALLAVLANAGHRVGLYTSPHLSSVRERFRINDTNISEADFAAMASRIRAVLGDTRITYFEFTTALALLWFVEQQVDLVILEVGMGGRLDATNVVTPLVSVITNVSMDHEAYLGNTLAAVAMEKAGIIKPGVPVVSGVAADESREVVEKTCAERGAPLYLLGRDFSVSSPAAGRLDYQGIFAATRWADLAVSLRGRHQAANMASVLAVLELLAERFPVPESALRQGLAAVRWPGRLEHFRLRLASCNGQPVYEQVAAAVDDPSARLYLLDGAHNPAGVESLVAALREDFAYDRLIMIWGSMADKDMAKTLALAAPVCDTLILTRPAGERSATAAQLFDRVPEAVRPRTVKTDSVAVALARAWEMAGPDDLICVAGSLYLVGAVRKALLGEVAA